MADFPNLNPDYPVTETPADPDVLISRHRDGSQQRRLRGAGPKRRWRVGFGTALPMPQSERDQIDAHFQGQNGSLTAFNWTHPETTEVILVIYVRRPTFTHVGFDLYSVDVEFEEVAA